MANAINNNKFNNNAQIVSADLGACEVLKRSNSTRVATGRAMRHVINDTQNTTPLRVKLIAPKAMKIGLNPAIANVPKCGIGRPR